MAAVKYFGMYLIAAGSLPFLVHVPIGHNSGGGPPLFPPPYTSV